MPETSLLCEKCGKPVDKSGSMTQWLFTKNKCACTNEATDENHQEQRTLRVCPICGLRLRGKHGSMTGWIFGGAKQCSCLDNEIVERQINTQDLPAKDLVGKEPFEWLGVAGEGGLGIVYKAKDLKLGRIVAVKVLQPDHEDARAGATFMREAKAASKLQHPNLVTISDFGMLEDGRHFLTIEWIDGMTLAEHLERHGPLSVEAAVEVFGQILDGLSHAHNRDVIHRDIKPSNIMLGRTTSGGWMVKLIDFGTAKEERQDGFLTRSEDMMCSPYYVSPERVSGLFVDRRTDLYSLGCTLFEALTGRPPFRGDALPVVMMHLNDVPPKLSEAAHDKKFPEYLEEIIAKLLAKNPDDRFATADDTRRALQDESIREDLYRLVEDQTVTTSVKAQRSQALLWLLPVVVLLVSGLAAWLISASVQNDKQSPATSEPTQTAQSDGLDDGSASGITDFGTAEVVLGAPTKADWLQLKKSAQSKKLVIGDCVFMPSNAFTGLACADSLEHIEFNMCSKLNSKALPSLQDCPKLRHLSFSDCILSKNFVLALGQLSNVDFIEMKFCNLKTEALSGLNDSSGLKLLMLPGSGVTDKDVATLRNPMLGVLDLSDNEITGECFKQMNCRHSLRNVVLHGLTATQFDFSGLKDYVKVSGIELGGTKISAKTLNELAQIPNLVSLNLKGSPIDADAYKCFKNFPKLSNLALSETQTQDKDLEYLKGMQQLVRLDLRDSKVTKEGFKKFEAFGKGKFTVVPPWYVKPN